MSTIDTAVEKLKILVEELNEIDEEQYEEVCRDAVVIDIKKVISLLTDPTVLLIEWNEIDIQGVAREKLANMDNVKIEQIIENPLPKERVEVIIALLEHRYDCNLGVTWDTINCILDEVVLPDAASCRVKLEYPRYTDEWIQKVKPGLYLGMFHGFHSLEERQSAGCWGEAGPLIGPLRYIHTTYGVHVNLEFENPEDEAVYGLTDTNFVLGIDKEGCLIFGDMQYGDWSVFYINKGGTYGIVQSDEKRNRTDTENL